MSIELFKKIAFRLTRITVVIAFLLGIVISAGQVMFDFNKERNSIETAANEIFSVSESSAYRIAYQLDDIYANELIDGLKRYKILHAARLLDDRQAVIAQFENQTSLQSNHFLTERIVGTLNTFTYPLLSERGELAGYLQLVTDNYVAMSPFYDRALYVFLSGFLRNMALASILLVVFYFIITKPLISMAQQLSEIDPRKPNGNRLDTIDDHKHSELGYIIDSVNDFIEHSDEQLTQTNQLKKRLSTIINSVPLHILAVNDHGEILFSNQLADEFFELKDEEKQAKLKFALASGSSPKEYSALLDALRHVIIHHESKQIDEYELRNSEGQMRTFELSIVPLQSQSVASALIVFNDISSRVASQRVIKQLAYHDSLTGLSNRVHFQQILTDDIKRSNANGHYGALIFIDLDKFKLINDTLGHGMGDSLLIDVANKITHLLRNRGSVARIGGDEFALSLPNLSDSHEIATALAMQMGKEINIMLNNNIDLAGQGFQVGASIGVVCYPQASGDVENLLRFADAAVYQAKNEGRNRVKLFEHKILDEITQQLQTETELRLAIRNRQFEIVLQPIYSGQNKAPAAAEVLIRWRHPEKGLIGPFYFINSIESLNLSHHISSIAIEQCGEVVKQLDIDELVERGFRFSINVSTLEFYEPDFTQRIAKAVKATGVPFSLFELEITENIALHDLILANQKLNLLTQMGITIALDDFGTGYSSLSYLKNLDVDKVKIDKIFLDGIEEDTQDQKLVDSIITIAKNFELKVVVEGIEHNTQLNWLSQYQDILYQGYLFNKPLHQDDFIDAMKGAKVLS